jgi:hypothetical protein
LLTGVASAQTAASVPSDASPPAAVNPQPAAESETLPAPVKPEATKPAPEPVTIPVGTRLSTEVGAAEATSPNQVVSKWSTKVYGFIEFDAVHDSTQAYNDLGGWGTTAIPQSYTYAGSHDRLQFTARNSRFGFLVGTPEYSGVRGTGTLEGDFMGNQPGDANESSLITNGAFRLRVASLLLHSDYVDVLAGQAWSLFGFQPFFLPASPFLLPVPGEVFKRDAQVRLSHTFKSQPVDFELGLSANRPPQRDSGIPDVQAGLRLTLNGWKGVHTPGTDGQRIVGSGLDGLTIAVSGAGRRFRVTDFQPTAAGTYADPRGGSSKNGYGVVIDAMIPVIPASSVEDKGNAFTLIGEFSSGTGDADLLGGLVSNAGGPATTAAAYPAVPNSPDKYQPNIQNGLVTYDNTGGLHTINWQTFLVGAQYYLPPSGKVFVSANFAQAHSNNVANWADPGQIASIYDKTQYIDGNLFWDVTPAIRLAGSYQYLKQHFADNSSAHNTRTELTGYLWF